MAKQCTNPTPHAMEDAHAHCTQCGQPAAAGPAVACTGCQMDLSVYAKAATPLAFCPGCGLEQTAADTDLEAVLADMGAYAKSARPEYGALPVINEEELAPTAEVEALLAAGRDADGDIDARPAFAAMFKAVSLVGAAQKEYANLLRAQGADHGKSIVLLLKSNQAMGRMLLDLAGRVDTLGNRPGLPKHTGRTITTAERLAGGGGSAPVAETGPVDGAIWAKCTSVLDPVEIELLSRLIPPHTAHGRGVQFLKTNEAAVGATGLAMRVEQILSTSH